MEHLVVLLLFFTNFLEWGFLRKRLNSIKIGEIRQKLRKNEGTQVTIEKKKYWRNNMSLLNLDYSRSFRQICFTT